jgi:hypothetical protein
MEASTWAKGWKRCSWTEGGIVTFTDGVFKLGTAKIDNNGKAVFTTSALKLGRHSITATYAGNTMFSSSSSGLTQAILTRMPIFTSVFASINSTPRNTQNNFILAAKPLAIVAKDFVFVRNAQFVPSLMHNQTRQNINARNRPVDEFMVSRNQQIATVDWILGKDGIFSLFPLDRKKW